MKFIKVILVFILIETVRLDSISSAQDKSLNQTSSQKFESITEVTKNTVISSTIKITTTEKHHKCSHNCNCHHGKHCNCRRCKYHRKMKHKKINNNNNNNNNNN